MKEKISQMLAEAYAKLGITNKNENARYVQAAHQYLSMDRERYVEIAETDQPEYLTSVQQGTICSMVPLAISKITDEAKNYWEIFTAVLYLTVTAEKTGYVYAYAKKRIYSNPKDGFHNTVYGYPFYRYTTLDNLIESLEPRLPEQIVPVATDWELENFRMSFAVYAKFCRHLHINFIPHYAERALVRMLDAPEETHRVDGKSITAQFVPLVDSSSAQQTQEKDCRTRVYQKLFLAINETIQRYVLQTTTRRTFFKEIPLGEGGSCFEDTGEKSEITYQFVELDDVRGPMTPY